MRDTTTPRIVGISFIVFGVFIASFVVVSFLRRRSLLKNGVSTSGVVVGLDETSGSMSGASYAPIVRFTTDDGESRQYTPSFHTAWCNYRVGDSVSLVYDADNPARAVIPSYATGSYFMVLFLALVFICAGLFTVFVYPELP